MTPGNDLNPLQKAAVALAALRARHEALEQSAHEPIAIIGIGCRYPAGGEGPQGLWEAVRDGRDGSVEVPRERWDIDAVFDPTPGVPGKTYTRNACFIEGVDRFDPLFFRIAPREAVGIDPQQRLLLELVWEALEDAGIAPPSLVGSRTGVFLGISTNDYGALLSQTAHGSNANASAGAGNAASVASGRISYTFGFQGPCLAVDTACSSSLVAAHLAVRALRGRECNLAVVAGVNLMLAPEITINFSQGRMLSPDGHCKTFDASADGYARGEGCGVLVLKRLSDAQADGDRIVALVRGSAVNQDGRSAGLTAPNGLAQEAVIRQALEDARLGPDDIDYVEAHGTGTALGDPIEMHALRAVFGRRAQRPLRVGSVKTNIGHCEAAAGAAGIIKAALMLQHQAVPATLHFRQLNPHIDLAGADIRVPTSYEPLPLAAIGVSSFGFSGTNAHLVLGAAPARQCRTVVTDSARPRLLVSARSESALRVLIERYLALLAQPGVDWTDVCHTAAVGRARFAWWVLVDSPQQLANAQPSNGPCPSFDVPAGERIALPTYPFERERYWLDAPASAAGIQAAPGHHPLLGEPLPLPLSDEQRWMARLQPQADALQFVVEHEVQGQAVLPGSAWMELALAAGAGAAVTQLRLLVPLAWPASGPLPTLHTVARSDGRFQLATVAVDGGAPVVHASGRWAAADIADFTPGPSLPAGAEEVAPQSVYAAMRALGVTHGQSLQRLQSLQRTLQGDVGLVHAVVDAGDAAAGPAPWSWIHPAVLDAALQAVAAAVPGGGSETLVPARVERLSARRPLAGTLHCTVQARRAGRGVLADLWLHDAQGLGLVVHGLAFEPLRAQDGLGLHALELHPMPLLGAGPWATFFAPLDDVAEALQCEASRLGAAHGMADYAAADPALERIATQHAANALLALGVPLIPGESFTLRALADSVGVPPRHLRLFERMLKMLEQDGVLARRGTRWTCAAEPELVSVNALAEQLAASHPAVSGELAVLQRCGAALADVLQGRTDPLTLLFPSDDAGARTFYDGSPYARTVNGLLQAAAARLCTDLPAGRTLRVLEVGAGTGGATSAVMAGLPAGRWHYTFTDVSAAFLPQAQTRFGNGAFATSVLDLEHDLAAQGHAPGSYDLVVAANVLHATDDLRATLGRLRELLAPGGALLMVESTRARRWVDLVFGLTEGWWRFRDTGLRPDHPLLSLQRWQALLAELDLEHCSAPDGEVFVIRRPVRPVSQPTMRWQLTGAVAECDALAQHLRSRGELADAAAGPQAICLVHLLPPTPLDTKAQARLLHALAEQVLLAVQHQMRLVWVAQPGASHAGVAGLARTVAIEHPQLRLRLLVGAPGHDVLVDELLATHAEPEVHWSGGQRCVPQLRPVPAPTPQAPVVQGGPWLITGGYGGLGLACAGWLAQNGASRIVLLGSKAPPTLPRLGVPVVTLEGDVTDAACVAQALAHGPFEGVLHAAGRLDDAPLAQQTVERIERVLGPKISGALLLDQLTRVQPPRYFVLFSSVAGITGSAQQANHAWASSLLDALAAARRADGLPALSIDWGVWRDIGEAQRRGFARAADELGLGSMDAATGLHALQAALAWPGEHCVVLPGVDWQRLAAHFGSALPRLYAQVVQLAKEASMAAQEQPVEAGFGQTQDGVPHTAASSALAAPASPQERVAAVIAGVLGLPAGFDRSVPLYELGLDSLGAVEIRNRLQQSLGLDVTVRELIEGASAQALADRGAAGVASADPMKQPGDDGRAEALQEIVRDVLGLRHAVAQGTPLYELGLDSLSAVQIRNRVEQRFGVQLSVRELIEGATLDQLLARLRPVDGPAAPPLSPALATAAEADAPFPLTDMQLAYWLGQRSDMALGDVGCYLYTEFDSDRIDLDRLEQAWNLLVARHGMLRVVILPDATQQILPKVPWYRFERTDLRGSDDAPAQLLHLREGLARRRAAAGQWPLFDVRVTLHGTQARIHTGFDLMALDAASIYALRQEWGRLYENLQLALPPIMYSFRDYVLAERALRGGAEWERALAYWNARAATLPPAPQLPVLPDTSRQQAPRFVRHRVRLDERQALRLREEARQRGLTLPTVLAAAYADTLAAFSRAPRFTLTVTTFNRRPLHPDVEVLLGDFTSTLLLEIDASAPTFAERAVTLSRRLVEDLDHSLVGGNHVLREVARVRGGALQTVPVVFTSALGFRKAAALEAVASEAAGWDRLGTTVHNVSSTPQVWIDHQISEEDGQLLCHWDVLEAAFAPGVVSAMLAAYERLLLALVDGAGWQYRLTDAALAGVIRPKLVVAPAPAQLLQTGFEHQAAQTPQRLALVSADAALDYRTLDRAACFLAAVLAQQLGGPDTARDRLVAVEYPKGWQQVVAVLAVLKTGAAYLPVDPALPAARREYLVQHGQALRLDDLALPAQALSAARSDVPAPRLPTVDDPSRLAYVIYTSGSTGEPKGVMVEHASALCTVQEVNRRWGVNGDDRVLALSALGFDLSVYDIFGLLAVGGTLVIPEPHAARDPSRWAQLLIEHQVTLWNTVPALLAMQLEYGLPAGHALRLVLLSGDWVPLDLVARLRAQAPQARLVVLGGATEAAIWSNAHEVEGLDPAWASVPYGQPLAGQLLHVVNETGLDLPDLVTGEIEISGRGLARGYWRDTQRTAQCFRTDAAGVRRYRTGDLGRFRSCTGQSEGLPPPIEFLGRADNQVKVQGFRIELGEIESALAAHPAVAQAVVAASEGTQRTLHGFVVARAAQVAPADPEAASWKDALEAARAAGAGLAQLPLAQFEQAAQLLSQHAVGVAAVALRSLAASNTIDGEQLLADGRVAPRYRGWLARMLPQVAELPAHWQPPPLQALTTLDTAGFEPEQFALLQEVAQRLPDILAERLHSSQIYLSAQTPQVYARLFAQPNALVAAVLAQLAASHDMARGPLSVLEVGAGLGTTLEAIAPALPDDRVRYLYTDVSAAMLARARREHRQRLPQIDFDTFDFNAGTSAPAASHDVVLATSALHAAADLRQALAVLRRQLRPGGVLVLLEQTRFLPWYDLGMGLQAGFDTRTDLDLRPLHPLLDRQAWISLLREAGFAQFELLTPPGTLADHMGLDVIVARLPLVPATTHERADEETLVPQLMTWLRSRLPAYMVPATLHCVAALPLSANGKVDRKQLLRQVRAAPALAATPTTVQNEAVQGCADSLQVRISEIVRELLPGAGNDPHRSLFEDGGTSLTLVTLHRRIADRLGLQLPLQALFEAPTVAGLARALGADQDAESVSGGDDALSDVPLLTDPQEREAYKRSRPALREGAPDALRMPLILPAGEGLQTLLARARSTRSFTGRPLLQETLGALLQVLTLSEGGSATGGAYLWPSAGSMWGLQVWLQVMPGGVDGLAAGFYYLHPERRDLELVEPGTPDPQQLHLPHNRAAYAGCACALYIVAPLDVLAPLYGGCTRDLCLLEAGHMGQLLHQAASQLELGLCTISELNLRALPAGLALGTRRPVASSYVLGWPAEAEGRTGPDTAGSGESLALVRFGPRRAELPQLFAMPGVLALPFQLQGLAQALAPHADLVTVQLPGVFDDAPVLDTLQAQATFVLQQLRVAQPHGPYRLCGLSYGGYLALEVARMLRSQGEVVPLLLLGDTVHTRTSLEAFQEDDTARLAMARALLALYGHRLDPRMVDLALPGGQLLDQVGQALEQAGVVRAGTLPIERLLAVFRANFRALGGWRPQPLPGDMALVRTDGGFPAEFGVHEDASVLQDPTLGWRPWVQGNLRLLRMPGDHLTMLHGTNLQVLAALLKQELSATI